MAKSKNKGKEGIVHIGSSFNNTIIHITDLSGKTITRISGGMITKHDRLKANPTIAMFAAKKAADEAMDAGITHLYVRIKGKTGNSSPGPGAHAAINALGKKGLKIKSIIDITSVPRGGPKPAGGKRGRRV